MVRKRPFVGGFANREWAETPDFALIPVPIGNPTRLVPVGESGDAQI